mmetsp:Transcript_561/g.2033  ORF Transcript_561/g.2033 Transcript_561/m.2033 type:complete len:192 (-) Transcript_561:1651-2226(-)
MSVGIQGSLLCSPRMCACREGHTGNLTTAHTFLSLIFCPYFYFRIMVRIGANRRIPAYAKQLMQNPLSQQQLLSHIASKKLFVPLQQSFVQDVQNNRASGFHFPITTSQQTESIPFFVPRTPSGELPVYIKYKSGRTLAVTVLKQAVGDLDILERDLGALTNQQVMRKPNGLEVRGNHVRLLKFWLRAIGF